MSEAGGGVDTNVLEDKKAEKKYKAREEIWGKWRIYERSPSERDKKKRAEKNGGRDGGKKRSPQKRSRGEGKYQSEVEEGR